MKKIIISLAALFAASLSYADVPQLINYQGRLLNGSNLVNGSVGLSLRLFNVLSGGTAQYEDSNSVTVVDGLYSTYMGDNTTMGSLTNALTNTAVYVEVAVNGTALSPRERLASVAYALVAANGGGMIGDSQLSTNVALLNRTNQVFSGDIAGPRLKIGNAPNVLSSYSSVAAGDGNSIGTNSANSIIGGGSYNTIQPSAGNSVLGGGCNNIIGTNSWQSFLGSGNYDIILPNSAFSFLGGGDHNNIQSYSGYSVLGGGQNNSIGPNAGFAVIPGGSSNTVGTGAQNAMAAGYRAKANHAGSFVWADKAEADFATAANNQFLVRASGGVGIGTANTSNAMLTVAGIVLANSFIGDGSGLTNISASQVVGMTASPWTVAGNNISYTNGNVGIGTLNPLSKIDLGSDSGLPKIRMYEDGGLDNKVGFGVDMSGNAYENSVYFGTNGNGHLAVGSYDGTTFNEKMRVTAAGNVGIGTNAPVEKLDVAGTIKASSIDASSGSASFGSLFVYGPVSAISYSGNGNKLTDLTLYSTGIVMATGLNIGWQGYLQPYTYSTIAGGEFNTNQAPDSFIGAGSRNNIDMNCAGDAIVGGFYNSIHGNNCFIGSGEINQIVGNSPDSFIGGGQYNVCSNAATSFIGGGAYNTISDNAGGDVAIVAGLGNSIGIEADASFIGGGENNAISNYARHAVIVGGIGNSVGGDGLDLLRDSVIVGGAQNYVGGNHGFIGGGQNNSIGVGADRAMAAGYRAKANHSGSFVWGDSTEADVSTTSSNQFVVRASGGICLNGNVGIGTNSPQAKLQVAGDVKLGSDGSLFAPGGQENLRIVRGSVKYDGTVQYGSGFTTVKNSTGTYTITFSPAFSDVPTVVAIGNAGAMASLNGVGASTCVIKTYWGFGTNTDSYFYFIAAGPR